MKTTVNLNKIDKQIFYNLDDNKNNKDDFFKDFVKYCETNIESQDKDFIKLSNYINIFAKNSFKAELFWFSTGKEPDWLPFVEDFFKNGGKFKSFKDENDSEYIKKTKTNFPSYLLILGHDCDIYVATAGRGNSIIDGVKDKVFGIDILSRLVSEDSTIVRYISDKRIYGLRNATKLSNRSSSAFITEQNVESIYNDIGVTLDPQQLLTLGIIENTPDNHQPVSVNFGHGIDIKKDLSIIDINRVIQNIKLIEDQEPNFVVNFLVLSSKKGIRKERATKELIEVLNKDPNKLSISYFHELNNNMSKYDIKKSTGNPIDDENYSTYLGYRPNSLEDLEKLMIKYIEVKNQKPNFISNYFIELTKNIESSDLKEKYNLIDLLEQNITVDNNELFLLEGNWYVFDVRYFDEMDRRYKKLLENSDKVCNELFGEAEMNLNVKEYSKESELKCAISNADNIIDADECYFKNVEVADAFYIKEDTVYLLHNKTSFSGKGTRDLIGQIETSSKVLVQMLRGRSNIEDEIENYKHQLQNKTKKNEKSKLVNNIELVKYLFKKLRLSSIKICYIATYTDNVTKSVNSTYIKFLLQNAERKLISDELMFLVH